MVQREDGTFEVNFLELWSAVGGGTRFTQDQIVEMMAAAVDAKEDFIFVHYNQRYRVTQNSMGEYFSANPRPERPSSLAEKLRKVEKENAELKIEIAVLKGTANVFPSGPMQVKSPVPDRAEMEKRFFEVDPTKLPREKQDFSQIQAELKKELAGKKPIKNPRPPV